MTNPTEGEAESFAALVARYRDDPDEDIEVHTASLAAVLAGGEDPLRVVSYLTGLGLPVRTLDDVLAINLDPTEDELHAFRCAEGVAVSIASDGLWVLLTP